MTALTRRARFLTNNFAASATLTATSASTGYPAANIQNEARSKVTKPAGYFLVTTANQNIYFNDGADKTAVIAAGAYTSRSDFIGAVEAALNAVSSGWICSTGSVLWTFRIARIPTNGTLRKSVTTNAAWDMLGYTTGTDELAGNADFVRIHTHERYTFDLGTAKAVTAFAMIAALGETFTPSVNAVMKLEADNLNVFDTSTPAFSRTLTRSDRGVIEWLDDDTPTYRYFSFYIQDRTNPLGSAGLKFGLAWLGTFTELATRSVAPGLNITGEDPSELATSEAGQEWAVERTRYRTFDSLVMTNLPAADRATLEAVYTTVGKTTPFFFAIDPLVAISNDAFDLTAFVRFRAWQLTSTFRGYFNLRFAVEEAR